jgi:hypothetical protein
MTIISIKNLQIWMASSSQMKMEGNFITKRSDLNP